MDMVRDKLNVLLSLTSYSLNQLDITAKHELSRGMGH